MKLWRILSVCMLVFCCGSVLASQINRNSGLGLGRSGPNTARGTVTPTGGTFGELLNKPANLNGGQTEFGRLLEMPFKLPDIPPDKANVKGVLTPANIGKALRGGVGGYLAGEAFKRLAEEACVRMMGGTMQLTESGAWEECVPGTPVPQSDGKEYRLSTGFTDTGWSTSRDATCNTFVGQQNGSQTTYTYSFKSTDETTCKYKIIVRATGAVQAENAGMVFQTKFSETCPAGWYITSSGCQQTKPEQPQEYAPVSTERAQQKLEDAIKAPGNASKVWDAMRDYADKGGEFDMDQPLSVEGPAQSPTSTTTTQTTQQTANGPQTLTTTNTTVINYHYSGDTITVNQTTTSVTRNEAGDVVSSTTTNGTPEASDEPPTDTPLPPVPDLYVRKYPNGIVGIWNEKSEEIKQAPLFKLAADLMPDVGSGGTCPSWPLNLDFASWAQFGTKDVAPPCVTWDWARLFVIIGALLLARALIFGG